jgi:pyridoxine 5-phosphate synthase
MAATDDMVAIALDTRPHACCLVPEKRSERTTEGGLDVIGGHDHLKIVTAELLKAGIRVSLFIEPSLEAVRASRSIGAPVTELHTGAWCDALAHGEADRAGHEFARIKAAAALASDQGLECHAGHGLDFATARIVAGLPEIVELNIGHFLIGEAVFIGLNAAIAKMRAAMDEGRRLTADQA